MQPLEDALGTLAHHQVGRLQQHLAPGGADHAHDVVGELQRALSVRLVGLGRQVAEIVDVAGAQRGLDQPRPQPGRILGHLLQPGHPQRPAVVRRLPDRRCGVGQDAPIDVAQVGQRRGALVPPEQLETGGHLPGGGTADHHVAVDVVEIVVPVEVAILVVASAGDADAVVHQQQLVVHALVEMHEAAQHAGGEFQRLRVGLVKGGVVQPHLQVGADPRQPVEQIHVVQREQLVRQDAHLHPAPRRLHQFVQHQLAGVVLIPDEGLHVDRLARRANQVDARGQRRLGVVQQGHHMYRLLRGRLGQRPDGGVAQG